MKILTFSLFILVNILASRAYAQNTPEQQYWADLEAARAKYRASQAELLKKADRVVLYIVDFEESEVKQAAESRDDTTIQISPYNSSTKVLEKKELSAEERKKVLTALCKALAEPKHTGGAFCHFPIHGIRIYHGKHLLHEGTFCWFCCNFGFNYPDGAAWLDVTDEMEQAFSAALPIPEKELKRFHGKYPGFAPKDKAESPATPEKEASGSTKPKKAEKPEKAEKR